MNMKLSFTQLDLGAVSTLGRTGSFHRGFTLRHARSGYPDSDGQITDVNQTLSSEVRPKSRTSKV